jgi:hypothetical protein
LQAFEHQAQGLAAFSPVKDLTGRPLFGNGANGAAGTGQADGPGNTGNPGGGASDRTGGTGGTGGAAALAKASPPATSSSLSGAGCEALSY